MTIVGALVVDTDTGSVVLVAGRLPFKSKGADVFAPCTAKAVAVTKVPPDEDIVITSDVRIPTDTEYHSVIGWLPGDAVARSANVPRVGEETVVEEAKLVTTKTTMTSFA